MKKFIFVALFVLALVFYVAPVYALDCANGNYGSDACWTNAQLTTNDTAVIPGTVMVYDFTTPTQQGNSADLAAFNVRAATSADQNTIVAGVAQKTYSSGDRVMLLVRGQGKIRSTVALTSGDRMYVTANAGAQHGLATNVYTSPTSGVSFDKAIAFSLSTTTAAATADAYIVVV